MKKICLLALLISGFLNSEASTSITTSTVSGHWTVTGSPYLIYNNITLSGDSALIIDPGVEIIFQGYYSFTVRGLLNASGSTGLPIYFHIQDTTGWSDATTNNGGWNGILFYYISDSLAAITTFNYCKMADMKGGGILVQYTAISVYNCEFTHNNGNVYNTYVTDSTHTNIFSGCSVHDNIARYYNLYFSGGILNVNNCKFYNNQTGLSLFYAFNLKFNISNNEFYQNVQKDSTLATTVNINTSNGIIKSNKIHHNISQFDGALCCTGGIYDINANLICNNQALVGFIGSSACGSTEGGGGARLSGEGATIPTYFYFRNNVIANNYAGLQGGGIDIFWACATIANNTIINNTGYYGGGIFIFNCPYTSDSTSVKIKNNILKNNYAITGAMQNLWVGYADRLSYEKNWTDNHFSQDLYIAASFILDGDTSTNVVGSNPHFIDPTTTYDTSEDAVSKNFGLLSSSACINSGDSAGAYSSLVDYAGNQRIWGGCIDIGAYEYGSVPTGFTENKKLENEVYAFPNPATDNIYFSVPTANGTIELLDNTGRLILEKQVLSTITSIDLKTFPKGVYFAVYHANNGQLTTQKIDVK